MIAQNRSNLSVYHINCGPLYIQLRMKTDQICFEIIRLMYFHETIPGTAMTKPPATRHIYQVYNTPIESHVQSAHNCIINQRSS